MNPGSTVTFSSSNGLAVTVLLDAPSPVLTDGFGGWETVDRPRRTQMTRFKGRNPFRQDLAIIFDGFLSNTSQETAISTLTAMAQQPSHLADPPRIKLIGTALHKHLWWVIESIDWDNQKSIWDMLGNVPARLRQHAVVHLLEYVDDTVITTPANPFVNTNVGKQVTTPQGMTLKQVAQLEYGDAKQYYRIIQANPWLDPDPRKVIPAGTQLFIPDKNGFTEKTFIVP